MFRVYAGSHTRSYSRTKPVISNTVHCVEDIILIVCYRSYCETGDSSCIQKYKMTLRSGRRDSFTRRKWDIASANIISDLSKSCEEYKYVRKNKTPL